MDILEELQKLAESVALEVGKKTLSYYASPLAIIEKSGPRDLVSLADTECEQLAVSMIEDARPEDSYLNEEGSAKSNPGAEFIWAVDPIDGPTNFLQQIPHWCVSIGVESSAGESLVGVIYDPLREELFSARKDGGTTLNAQPVASSRKENLTEAIWAFGIDADWNSPFGRPLIVDSLLLAVAHGRQMGSMALDMGWLACGRCDLYLYEAGMHPHDISQRVIMEETGLIVEKFASIPGKGCQGLFAAAPGLAKEAKLYLGR